MTNIWISNNYHNKYQSIPSTDDHDDHNFINENNIEIKIHSTKLILDDLLLKNHIYEKRRYFLSTSIFLLIFFLVCGLLYWFNETMQSKYIMKLSSYANITSPVMSPTSRPYTMAPWSIYIPELYRPVVNNNMESAPSTISNSASNIPPYAIWIPIPYNPYYFPSCEPSNIPVHSKTDVNIPILVNIKDDKIDISSDVNIPIPSKNKVKDIARSLEKHLLDEDVYITDSLT